VSSSTANAASPLQLTAAPKSGGSSVQRTAAREAAVVAATAARAADVAAARDFPLVAGLLALLQCAERCVDAHPPLKHIANAHVCCLV
jgi:hypothetical protein